MGKEVYREVKRVKTGFDAGAAAIAPVASSVTTVTSRLEAVRHEQCARWR